MLHAAADPTKVAQPGMRIAQRFAGLGLVEELSGLRRLAAPGDRGSG
jgi:hypothetical protein